VDADVPANERRHTERIKRGKEMKEHFCPAEKSIITYQDKCNWCGEREALAQTQDTWVGLTDEERIEIDHLALSRVQAVQMTEAKLKEKNT
jgi:hypothetical protein